MSSTHLVVYAQEIRKPKEPCRLDQYWLRYDQKRGVYFRDNTYRNILSAFIFLFPCSGSQIDIYSVYHLHNSCWTLCLINVEVNVALGATVDRKEAVRSNLGEIRSRTGLNFSRARVTTEVKCLPPTSLYMHRRFENRIN